LKPNLLAGRSLVAPGATAGGSVDEESTVANMRNWMGCIRSRKTTNAHIEAGYSHSVALCMTIAAMHTGQRATFDDARQEVVPGPSTSPTAPTASRKE
jgi:hypothetical protein